MGGMSLSAEAIVPSGVPARELRAGDVVVWDQGTWDVRTVNAAVPIGGSVQVTFSDGALALVAPDAVKLALARVPTAIPPKPTHLPTTLEPDAPSEVAL